MMDDRHECEWDVVVLDDAQSFSIFCAFKGCDKTPSVNKIITMLNEYETLRGENEALKEAAQDTIDQGYPTQKLYDALSTD